MSRCDLEVAALLNGLDALWQRSGKRLPNDLFQPIALDERDRWRLKLAQRLAGGHIVDDKPLALTSIFGSVALSKIERKGNTQRTRPEAVGHLPVSVVSVSGDQPSIYPSEGYKDSYSSVVSALESEIRQLQRIDPDHPAYLEGLYLLLARFIANVPVSSQAQDVSLFDFNHVVAAVCSCLRGIDDAEIKRLYDLTDRQLLAAKDTIGYLVGGDIAGVQEFIYNIRVKGAGRGLRGRSLYLQVLTEAVGRSVLRRLALPVTSMIYSGGAHFFLLSPHAIDDTIREEITRLLLTYHGRDLYLTIGSTTVRAADFADGAMSSRWGDVHAVLSTSKNQRYKEVDERQYYRQIFQPIPTNRADEEDDEESKDDFFEIGRALPNASHIFYGLSTPHVIGDDSNLEDIHDFLAGFGVHFAIAGKKMWPEQHNLGKCEYVVSLALNDHPTRVPNLGGNIVSVDSVRYTVNQIPEIDFDEIGSLPTFVDETVSHGIQRLGILRMDVDNLGTLFKDGLGERATLARIVSLSRTLSTFFEGRIGELCKQIEADYAQENPGAEQAIYAVYAGGDDVFLVGPWHLMPRLAALIRREFDRLTNNHPDLTISGGIALAVRKYPLYQAADDAAEALDRAKDHMQADVKVKNSLCFLDEVLSWDTALPMNYAQVEAWADRFIEYGRHAKLPTSVLGVLINLELMRRDILKQRREAEAPTQQGKRGDDRYGRWIWAGIYQLYRLREQYQKSRPEAAILIADILAELQNNHFEQLSTLALAARWAHLVLRRSREDDFSERAR